MFTFPKDIFYLKIISYILISEAFVKLIELDSNVVRILYVVLEKLLNQDISIWIFTMSILIKSVALP